MAFLKPVGAWWRIELWVLCFCAILASLMFFILIISMISLRNIFTLFVALLRVCEKSCMLRWTFCLGQLCLSYSYLNVRCRACELSCVLICNSSSFICPSPCAWVGIRYLTFLCGIVWLQCCPAHKQYLAGDLVSYCTRVHDKYMWFCSFVRSFVYCT